jgi:protein SCO1/2
MKFRASVSLLVFAFLCTLSAQEAATPAPAQLAVPDAPVVNQSGEHLRFNSGVIKGRVAVVTSFFTTCTAMCPITQENLSHLAKRLGDRLGKDVVIVSVSVDPVTDTPERMKAWGEKFHVGPGWALVSGDKTQVDALLQSLGLYLALPRRHESALLIGNQKAGWVRVSSWSSPDKLVKVIDGLAPAAARQAAGGSSGSGN